jgi:hypothetical protein
MVLVAERHRLIAHDVDFGQIVGAKDHNQEPAEEAEDHDTAEDSDSRDGIRIAMEDLRHEVIRGRRSSIFAPRVAAKPGNLNPKQIALQSDVNFTRSLRAPACIETIHPPNGTHSPIASCEQTHLRTREVQRPWYARCLWRYTQGRLSCPHLRKNHMKSFSFSDVTGRHEAWASPRSLGLTWHRERLSKGICGVRCHDACISRAMRSMARSSRPSSGLNLQRARRQRKHGVDRRPPSRLSHPLTTASAYISERGRRRVAHAAACDASRRHRCG